VCFPIVASVLQQHDIVLCIICPSISDAPFVKQYYPDIWFGDTIPVIVPIQFSGKDNDGNKKDEKNASGHYSGPFTGNLQQLQLEQDLPFEKGTFEMRQTYIKKELKNLYSCMIEGGKSFWGSFFPHIKKKFDLFKIALLETVEVQDDEETAQTALQQYVPNSSIDEARQEFHRRMGSTHTHVYTSIFPVPRVPIVAVHVQNGEKILTVRNALSVVAAEQLCSEEEASSVIVTEFRTSDDQSNMDHFIALAMSNQIMDNLTTDEKLYQDVRFICDILICK
jgi:hypothetical protein